MAKATKKQALGRGLSSILNKDSNSAKPLNFKKKKSIIDDIDINLITVNPYQPRSNFNEETLKEAVKQAGNVKLIGVSVLTSFSDDDLKKLGFSNNVEKQVEILIRIASSAGLYGIVCSPREVKMVKKIAPNLVCFTPGVRLTSETHDQKRTMTPKEAIAQGADYLILGRPLTSGNPRENMRKIIQSLE